MLIEKKYGNIVAIGYGGNYEKYNYIMNYFN